jgi:hypothetical protein
VGHLFLLEGRQAYYWDFVASAHKKISPRCTAVAMSELQYITSKSQNEILSEIGTVGLDLSFRMHQSARESGFFFAER